MTASRTTGSRTEALANGQRLLAIDPRAAETQAREMLKIDPHDAAALRLLGRALRRLGEVEQAEIVERDAIRASSRNPLLVDAANAIASQELARAERLLRPYIAKMPDDAPAHLMLAQIAANVGAHDEATKLLQHTLDLMPAYGEAWLLLAKVYADTGALSAAMSAIENAPAAFRNGKRALRLKAALLSRLGEYEQAQNVHEQLLAIDSDAPAAWVAYGHLLRTIGRKQDAIAAYRRALAINFRYGEAWWSLSNLKTEPIAPTDLEAMRQAAQEGGSNENLFHLHFALGKAMEERGDHAAAFEHYHEANRLRRLTLNYDAREIERLVAHGKQQLAQAGIVTDLRQQPPANVIFIIGMPRSGSTLLEQILASHSMIEGTSELPYIPALAQQVSDATQLTDAECVSLRKTYLDMARGHCKSNRPFFIDKQPNNWMYLGLVRRILPDAKIIDIRRHPLASCVANFRQHFGQGQAFSYSLESIAHYYALYVELADYCRAVQPGSIHLIYYENLVQNMERELRDLFAYLDLPYEPECLQFYANARPVRTPSSEQVRQPLYRAALDEWRAYDPWLGPAKDILGHLIRTYPVGAPS